ncbi:MAG: hypothetical protein H2174_08040 [Vampirovibrio sp.]|nr:hypothetical protein [Vampirovibrio sp.]
MVIVPLLQEGYREEAIIVLLSFTNLNYNEIVDEITDLEGEESVYVLENQVTNIIQNGLKDESKFSQAIYNAQHIDSSISVSNEMERIKAHEFLKKIQKSVTNDRVLNLKNAHRIVVPDALLILSIRILTLYDIYGIEDFYLNLLMLSVYPILWHKEIDISYNPDNKALVVDYKLPLLEEVCVVDDNGKKFKEKEQNKLYSSVL